MHLPVSLRRHIPPLSLIGAVLALATLLGMLAALSGELALILTVLAISGASILMFHRVGVWVMCLLFPLVPTVLVPHQVLGITGLNPVNILTITTVISLTVAWLGSVLQRTPAELPPWPKALVWFYIVPIGLAALHGSMSVDRIPAYYLQIKAIAFTDASSYLRDAFMRPMFLVAFSLLVAMVFSKSRRPKFYIFAAMLGAMALCGLTATVLAGSGLSLDAMASTRARGVLSATGLHANEISLLLNCALAPTLFAMRGARGWVWLLLAICAAVFGTTVLLTFSRGGMGGLLLIMVAFLVHANSPRSAIAAVLLSVCVVLALPDAVVERASTGVATGDKGAISAGRSDVIWPHVIPVIFDSPIIGGGLGSILWSPPARSGAIAVAQTHNAYLGLLLDMGLLGFLSVTAFMVWAWRQVRAASREATEPFFKHFFAGVAVTIPLLFAQGISDDKFTPTPTQTFMWFGIGAALGYRARMAAGEKTAT